MIDEDELEVKDVAINDGNTGQEEYEDEQELNIIEEKQQPHLKKLFVSRKKKEIMKLIIST